MQFPSVGVVVKRKSDRVMLQPFQQNASESLDTLTVDLRNGTAELTPEPPMTRNCTVVPGVMGILKLQRATALVTIDEAKQVHSVAASSIPQLRRLFRSPNGTAIQFLK